MLGQSGALFFSCQRRSELLAAWMFGTGLRVASQGKCDGYPPVSPCSFPTLRRISSYCKSHRCSQVCLGLPYPLPPQRELNRPRGTKHCSLFPKSRALFVRAVRLADFEGQFPDGREGGLVLLVKCRTTLGGQVPPLYGVYGARCPQGRGEVCCSGGRDLCALGRSRFLLG